LDNIPKENFFMMNTSVDFYDPFFLEKLKNLHIVTKKLFHGRQKGKRKSLKKGTSLEFSDFRRYSPGDDFRFIDWTIHARLQRYMIRSFWDETNITVYVLIDTSMSMGFGKPDKLSYAKKLAASFASVALSNHDRISIAGFADTINDKIFSVTGEKQLSRCFNLLQKLEFSGETDFKSSMSKISQMTREPGIVIILSDLLYYSGYKDGLLRLLKQGHEVNLIKLNSQSEKIEDYSGDLRLYDSETGEYLDILVNHDLIDAVNKEKELYHKKIERFCKSAKIAFFETDTSIAFDEFVLKYFKTQLLRK